MGGREREGSSREGARRRKGKNVNGHDINHPNQIFLTKLNTSHGYILRSKPGSAAIPKSGMQKKKKNTNSFSARA